MILAGRDEEVRLMTANWTADRFAVLTSDPGLGATEFLRSGLMPALKQAGSFVVYFGAWEGRGFPLELKEAVAQVVRDQADDNFFAQEETLEDLLRRVLKLTGRPVALLLDQFEEYLRFHSGTDFSDAFDTELANAVNSHTGQIAVAIQEHATIPFGRLSHLIPNLMGFHVELKPVSVEAARQMVRGLAGEQYVSIDEPVVDAFVNAPAVQIKDGIHALLLSRGVARIVEAAGKRRPAVATMAAMEALGGANRIILECLDPELEKLNISHKDVLFRWCDVLVSTNGSRLAVTEKTLLEQAGKLGRFGATLLPILVGDSVLRTVDVNGGLRYELSRESLTVVLKDWWTRQEAKIASRRRANFRLRSMSIAGGCILTLYVVWLVLTWK